MEDINEIKKEVAREQAKKMKEMKQKKMGKKKHNYK